MRRLRFDFQEGGLSSPGMDETGDTFSSPELAAFPEVVAPDYAAAIWGEPNADDGDPETGHIIDHAAGATTATVLRGQEGTLARAHAAGTAWHHGPTAQDWDGPADALALIGPGLSGTFPGDVHVAAGTATEAIFRPDTQIDQSMLDIVVDGAQAAPSLRTLGRTAQKARSGDSCGILAWDQFTTATNPGSLVTDQSQDATVPSTLTVGPFKIPRAIPHIVVSVEALMFINSAADVTHPFLLYQWELHDADSGVLVSGPIPMMLEVEAVYRKGVASFPVINQGADTMKTYELWHRTLSAPAVADNFAGIDLAFGLAQMLVWGW